jgi:hypothetical protein
MRILCPLPLPDARPTGSKGEPLIKIIVAGSINWDINLFVQKFPRPGEEMPVARIARVPGGKAGNVSVTAARPSQVGIIGASAATTLQTQRYAFSRMRKSRLT